MESYNIAVIGATGVGKSSFVQRVLDLTRPPISNASTVRKVVDNVNHMITLLELDLEYFELNPSQPIQWPKQINGHIVPRVDAALILYDVTNKESIRELPQTVGMRLDPASRWCGLVLILESSCPDQLWSPRDPRRRQMRDLRRRVGG